MKCTALGAEKSITVYCFECLKIKTEKLLIISGFEHIMTVKKK